MKIAGAVLSSVSNVLRNTTKFGRYMTYSATSVTTFRAGRSSSSLYFNLFYSNGPHLGHALNKVVVASSSLPSVRFPVSYMCPRV